MDRERCVEARRFASRWDSRGGVEEGEKAADEIRFVRVVTVVGGEGCWYIPAREVEECECECEKVGGG